MTIEKTPEFDQSAPAMEVQGPGFKLLKQGDNYFSYAEWDRYKNRFEPEPKFVKISRKTPDELRGILEEVLYMSSKLRQTIDKMHTDVTANVDQFHEAAQLTDRTLVQKLRDDVDRAHNLLIEEAQKSNGLLAEKTALTEKVQTLEAEVKVLKKELKEQKKTGTGK